MVLHCVILFPQLLMGLSFPVKFYILHFFFFLSFLNRINFIKTILIRSQFVIRDFINKIQFEKFPYNFFFLSKITIKEEGRMEVSSLKKRFQIFQQSRHAIFKFKQKESLTNCSSIFKLVNLRDDFVYSKRLIVNFSFV